VIKALTRLGFIESRCSGSHVILKRTTDCGTFIVTVPLQKELAMGTLMSIIRQSGMTKEQFIESLK
jgi:predicted RNA binding protein YcfA (HicA-like mRNA interferase family)